MPAGVSVAAHGAPAPGDGLAHEHMPDFIDSDGCSQIVGLVGLLRRSCCRK